MAEKHSLINEIRKLQKIQSDLVSISGRTDSDRKLAMVQLRRQLSFQIGVISTEADKIFLIDANDEDTREFRSLLSAMRRAVALHQSNWPAIKLDEQNFAYRNSVKAVREANGNFLQWSKDNIGG